MIESSLSFKAINKVAQQQLAYIKFLSSNDLGKTGGHQSGIYITKESGRILFDPPSAKGDNHHKDIKIKWNDSIVSVSTFFYYGMKTRDEYRITKIPKKFSFFSDEYIGALFILVKESELEYAAFVLNTDLEIREFLDAFSLSSLDTGGILDNSTICASDKEPCSIQSTLNTDSMELYHMSACARQLGEDKYSNKRIDLNFSDWLKNESLLFKALERKLIRQQEAMPFNIEYALWSSVTLSNLRKNRLKFSVPNHLAYIFQHESLEFSFNDSISTQKFYFSDPQGNQKGKTTCLNILLTIRDSWKSLLDCLDVNCAQYVFTLQPSLSATVVDHLENNGVRLVVPQKLVSSYPKEVKQKLLTIGDFLSLLNKRDC